MRRVLFVIIALATVIALTGCKKELSKEELTLNYLNETYASEHDTFTFINCGYDLFPGSNDRCYFKSTKYNGEVTVRLWKDGKKYAVSDDNYYQLYMKDDVQEYLESITKQYAKVNIKFRFASLYENFKTFEEYLRSGKLQLDVYFISNNVFVDNDIQSILNEMANQKISGTFSFIKTNDYNLLSNYDLDYILNNQGELIETMQDYSINSTSFLIDNK